MLQMKEMNARTENAEPNSYTPDDQHIHYTIIEMESPNTSQARKSSKEKISTRDISLLAGTLDFRLGFQVLYGVWEIFHLFLCPTRAFL